MLEKLKVLIITLCFKNVRFIALSGFIYLNENFNWKSFNTYCKNKILF